MNDQSYYIALAVVDRISELAKDKFGSYSAFSRKMGWAKSRWGVTVNTGHSIRFQTLVKIAKLLDLSVEYLLTGRNKSPYVEENLSLQNIANRRIHGTQNIYSILSYFRKGKTKDMELKTLFEIEEVSKIDIMKLLRGAE